MRPSPNGSSAATRAPAGTPRCSRTTTPRRSRRSLPQLAWGAGPERPGAELRDARRPLAAARRRAGARPSRDERRGRAVPAGRRRSSRTSRRGPTSGAQWRSASEQAFGMDGFRDALEHVIELTPEGPAQGAAVLRARLPRGEPGHVGQPAGARDGRDVDRARARAGRRPTRPCAARALVARTNLDPAGTAAEARETLAIAQRHGFGWLLGSGLSPARALRHRRR